MEPPLAPETVVLRFAALSAALAPVLAFWLVVVLRKSTSYLREAMGVSFAVGVFVAFPLALTNWGLDAALADQFGPQATALIRAFFVAAAPEETAKFLVLLFVGLRHEDMARPSNAVWLAVAVALGYAAIENVLYVFETVHWEIVAASRALTAVPSHAFAGLIMGTFVALGLSHGERRRQFFALALILPIIEHGLYDAVLMLGTTTMANSTLRAVLAVIFVAIMAGELILAALILRWLRRARSLRREFARAAAPAQ